MSKDIKKEGTIAFSCGHEHPDWSTNDFGYVFTNQIGGCSTRVIKSPDRKLLVMISGIHDRTYQFETQMPKCEPNLFVGITWADTLKLYLNGKLDIEGPISSDDKLAIARAAAIEGYASVEEGLANLFALFLGTAPEKAGAIFFRITNTHSRNRIMEQLLESSLGKKFDAYWHGAKHESGLFALIRQLDQSRNEIVHWRVRRTFSLKDSSLETRDELVPPNVWQQNPNTTMISATTLNEFRAKADFVHRSLTMFNIFVRPGNVVPQPAWQEIFSAPVAYPPADTHPLSPNYKEPQTPPQSSQA
jgi:hypothetical protein